MTLSPDEQEAFSVELSSINRDFPIIPKLTDYLKKHGHLKGIQIGWHCHLTSLTAAAAEGLLASGSRLALSECNPATTDMSAVDWMRRAGASVFLGDDSCASVLSTHPSLISDTGLALISQYLACGSREVHGACEITTSGINRLRSRNNMPLPVVNINHGRLKSSIENSHGVGEGLLTGLSRVTGKMWSGRPVAVVGYGPVGRGVAHYLKIMGALVTVVEIDPVAKLIAHYDGYQLSSVEKAVASSELLVTATGHSGLIGKREWQLAHDGLMVVNVGHWSQEIDAQCLAAIARSSKPVSDYLVEYLIADGSEWKRVYLATGGNPANIVMMSGSIEPPLIHLTTEILCLDYLSREAANLQPGEVALPQSVEVIASELALSAIGLSAK